MSEGDNPNAAQGGGTGERHHRKHHPEDAEAEIGDAAVEAARKQTEEAEGTEAAATGPGAPS